MMLGPKRRLAALVRLDGPIIGRADGDIVGQRISRERRQQKVVGRDVLEHLAGGAHALAGAPFPRLGGHGFGESDDPRVTDALATLARRDAGLSQRELARAAGTSQGAIAAYESARRASAITISY